MIVGESWGREELFAGKPFVGQSGQEFERICQEAGIPWDSCLRTNVFNIRPPNNDIGRLLPPFDKKGPFFRCLNLPPSMIAEVQRLYRQIEAFPRTLIIAAGNYALWALSDVSSYARKSYPGLDGSRNEPTGILNWRASQIHTEALPSGRQIPLLPIIHPAAILREWAYRQTTVCDLQRSANVLHSWQPRNPPRIIIPRSVAEIYSWFQHILAQTQGGNKIRLANDIETYKGLITIIGFGRGNFDETGEALVIPLVRAIGEGQICSWWSIREEAEIFSIIRSILSHPSILLEGQNYLYDTQYFIRWMNVRPRCDMDTMRGQHLLFPGTPKGLAYLSSLYCKYHRYWKDDGKDWAISGDQEAQLLYNGEDCLRTFECATVIRKLICDFELSEQWRWQQKKSEMVLDIMLRGIRTDLKHRDLLRRQVMLEKIRIHARLARMVPKFLLPEMKTSKVPWWESEHQQKILFYEILGLQGKLHRKTKRPTINDEALNDLEKEYPEFSTLWKHLKAERSLGVFFSTFLEAKIDPDSRMRSSFGEAETFRLTSSANVFGSGTNMQNIPSGDEE